ncbi:MAG: SRPBCC family protein, partial [Bacteroidota bacterium]
MKKTKSKKGVVITRTFNAPQKVVWEAWTHAEKLKQWWGPRGFSCPHVEIDLRERGTFLNCMRSPEGKDFWTTGTFKEITAPQKLVFSDSFADPDGNIVPAS